MLTKITYKNKLDLSQRIDAEHYSPRFDKLLNIINQKDHITLKSTLLKKIITGHTPSTTNKSYYSKDGTKLLKTNNLREFKIEHHDVQFISALGNNEIKDSELKENDVLVTIIGATEKIISRASRISKDILPANINQNIALIRSNLPSGYTSTYINSKYGKLQMYWLSRQTEQVNLNCKEVEQIKIPNLDNKFQKFIHEKYIHAEQLSKKSKIFINLAENILLKDLNFLNWNPKNNLFFSHNFKKLESSNRIDAEYYQPKYKELSKKIISLKSGYFLLGDKDKIEIINQNFTPDEAKEYNYIDLSDIKHNGEIDTSETIIGSNLPTRARRLIKKGNVLVSSIEGSLQLVALADSSQDEHLCSTGFYVLKSSKLNSETLFILMRSIIGQMQLKKGCNGTILTSINLDEIKKIILPSILEKNQKKIKVEIEKLYHYKKTSNRIFNVLKKGLEIAIEKNEKKSMEWINSQIKKNDV